MLRSAELPLSWALSTAQHPQAQSAAECAGGYGGAQHAARAQHAPRNWCQCRGKISCATPHANLAISHTHENDSQ